MKLEQQVTSLELSKRLKELGVKQESQFAWDNRARFDGGFDLHNLGARAVAFLSAHNKGCAAFTVAELGELLPVYFYTNKTKTKGWSCCDQQAGSCGKGKRTPTLQADTEAEARGLMLEYLLVNKLMTI